MLFYVYKFVATTKVRLGTPIHILPYGIPAFKTTFPKF